jgi:hypothetical protein
MGKHKLAEVFIFRNEDSFLLRGKIKYLGIVCPWGNFGNGQDIMARVSESLNHRKVAAFIRKKAHNLFPD